MIRQAQLGDAIAAARVLRALPAAARLAAIARLIAMAERADAWRRRTGRPHPRFGSGSLMAAALRCPAVPEPGLADAEWRACLILALSALDRHLSAWGRCPLAPAGGPPILPHEPSRGALMTQTAAAALPRDPVWDRMCDEARAALRAEEALSVLLHRRILDHDTLEAALGHAIAERLATADLGAGVLARLSAEMHRATAEPGVAARADLAAVLARDPACHRLIEPMLYLKGFQAVQAHRLAHWLWAGGRFDLALWLQGRVSEVLGVDIHPAARIGRGIMIDHAHGVVIGETAVVGNNVSLLHGVTLGGTGKDEGDRHPKIAEGVLIGAGATVLGNITIGRCSRIAAGSVVLADVPPATTVAGVPARVIGEAGCPEPAAAMDQILRGA